MLLLHAIINLYRVEQSTYQFQAVLVVVHQQIVSAHVQVYKLTYLINVQQPNHKYYRLLT